MRYAAPAFNLAQLAGTIGKKAKRNNPYLVKAQVNTNRQSYTPRDLGLSAMINQQGNAAM